MRSHGTNLIYAFKKNLSISFLCSSNKQPENKHLKNTTYNSIKKCKTDLQIDIVKDVQALYIDSYRTFLEKLNKI
jgi:uncharacterized protein YdeI (YjbR/CyaY-like superfamily)